MNKWPIVTFLNRAGKEELGELAEKYTNMGDIIYVVRINAKPKLVPSNYGLKELDFLYVEVMEKYIVT